MPKRLPNILLFAIDSIRRDHMSCYGYPRLTTPHFDQLARKGTLIENAFSAYIPTTPAYSSILTGRDVFSTGMVALSPKGPLDKKQPTLPEICKRAGYKSTCVGFDGGFYRGFDQYLNFEGWPAWEDRPARKAENLNAVAIPALERMAKSAKPWLLFLRHMDPHSPYLPLLSTSCSTRKTRATRKSSP
jgi:arylsulfatase A-like enzyme